MMAKYVQMTYIDMSLISSYIVCKLALKIAKSPLCLMYIVNHLQVWLAFQILVHLPLNLFAQTL